MVDFNMTQDAIVPDAPAPTHNPTCTGSLELVCQVSKTRTRIQNLGPKTNEELLQFLQSTATAWESAGYRMVQMSTQQVSTGIHLLMVVGWDE